MNKGRGRGALRATSPSTSSRHPNGGAFTSAGQASMGGGMTANSRRGRRNQGSSSKNAAVSGPNFATGGGRVPSSAAPPEAESSAPESVVQRVSDVNGGSSRTASTGRDSGGKGGARGGSQSQGGPANGVGKGGKRIQYAKTQFCPWIDRGKCYMKDKCNYAHSKSELRYKPDLTCTSLCPALEQGRPCRKPSCRYAHTVKELRATSAFYKTKICKYFLKGHCSAGATCRHAHGRAELRQPATTGTGQLSTSAEDSADEGEQFPAEVVTDGQPVRMRQKGPASSGAPGVSRAGFVGNKDRVVNDRAEGFYDDVAGGDGRSRRRRRGGGETRDFRFPTEEVRYTESDERPSGVSESFGGFQLLGGKVMFAEGSRQQFLPPHFGTIPPSATTKIDATPNSRFFETPKYNEEHHHHPEFYEDEDDDEEKQSWRLTFPSCRPRSQTANMTANDNDLASQEIYFNEERQWDEPLSLRTPPLRPLADDATDLLGRPSRVEEDNHHATFALREDRRSEQSIVGRRRSTACGSAPFEIANVLHDLPTAYSSHHHSTAAPAASELELIRCITEQDQTATPVLESCTPAMGDGVSRGVGFGGVRPESSVTFGSTNAALHQLLSTSAHCDDENTTTTMAAADLCSDSQLGESMPNFTSPVAIDKFRSPQLTARTEFLSIDGDGGMHLREGHGGSVPNSALLHPLASPVLDYIRDTRRLSLFAFEESAATVASSSTATLVNRFSAGGAMLPNGAVADAAARLLLGRPSDTAVGGGVQRASVDLHSRCQEADDASRRDFSTLAALLKERNDESTTTITMATRATMTATPESVHGAIPVPVSTDTATGRTVSTTGSNSGVPSISFGYVGTDSPSTIPARQEIGFLTDPQSPFSIAAAADLSGDPFHIDDPRSSSPPLNPMMMQTFRTVSQFWASDDGDGDEGDDSTIPEFSFSGMVDPILSAPNAVTDTSAGQQYTPAGSGSALSAEAPPFFPLSSAGDRQSVDTISHSKTAGRPLATPLGDGSAFEVAGRKLRSKQEYPAAYQFHHADATALELANFTDPDQATLTPAIASIKDFNPRSNDHDTNSGRDTVKFVLPSRHHPGEVVTSSSAVISAGPNDKLLSNGDGNNGNRGILMQGRASRQEAARLAVPSGSGSTTASGTSVEGRAMKTRGIDDVAGVADSRDSLSSTTLLVDEDRRWLINRDEPEDVEAEDCERCEEDLEYEDDEDDDEEIERRKVLDIALEVVRILSHSGKPKSTRRSTMALGSRNSRNGKQLPTRHSFQQDSCLQDDIRPQGVSRIATASTTDAVLSSSYNASDLSPVLAAVNGDSQATTTFEADLPYSVPSLAPLSFEKGPYHQTQSATSSSSSSFQLDGHQRSPNGQRQLLASDARQSYQGVTSADDAAAALMRPSSTEEQILRIAASYLSSADDTNVY